MNSVSALRISIVFFVAVSLIFCLPCSGQSNFFQPADSLHTGRVWLVGTTVAAGTIGSIAALSQIWYTDYEQGDFRFFNDNGEWLQMDKAGHAFSAYQITQYGYEAFKWSGTSERTSLIASGAISLTFLTAIEVLDGFSTGWGFSTGDMIANIAGTAMFSAQQLGWKEQRLSIKFSYSPSEYAQYRPETLGQSSLERLVKDYNGQTYWLSANIHSLTGKPKFIPAWLNFAFGYGADGMLGGFDNPMFNSQGEPLPHFERQRQYFLSFDVDIRRISTNSHLLKTLFSVVGFIKIPAPTIEFRAGKVYGHWLYF
jgi:hypothetical protein